MHHQANDTDDPERLRVVLLHVPEDDSKDDTTKVASSTSHPRDNTIGLRLNVWHESEVCPIASFQKDSHTSNEPKHSRRVMGIREANGEQESPGDNAQEVNPGFLDPRRRKALVKEVGDDATERSCDNIEKAKHSGPLAAGGLAKLLEVLLVVISKDRVD